MKNEPKQVIVARTDINMPAGKLAAQVAHASMATLLMLLRDNNGKITDNEVIAGSPLHVWLEGSFTKVVVGVESEQGLYDVQAVAYDLLGIHYPMIVDEGRTVFDGVATPTCIAIGPLLPEQFVGITDKLKLYR